MEYNIADRMGQVEGSVIRQLLTLAGDPKMISFGSGNPASEAFPVAEIAAITARVLAEDPIAMLQYGLSEGYAPLRDTLKTRLKAEGIGFENNELYIVSGGQQACDLMAKLFVNEGETVIVEEPSFMGALNTFRSYGAKLVGVPMEADGMDLSALEQALKSHPDCRFIYMIPNFQNPTGFTTSLEKRRAIYALAQRYDVLILEDDPYGTLRFAGEAVPSLKSLDTDGRVVYTGSFSKVMAPAFRLGYMVFDAALSDRFAAAKQCVDVHSNLLFQHICYAYMTQYDFEGHIDRLKALYARKAALMVEAMTTHFHPAVRFNSPEGGLFIMAFLPDGKDAYPFVAEGITRGVLTVPGVAFAADPQKPSSGFRLNFSTPSDEQILQGCKILGELTHAWLG